MFNKVFNAFLVVLFAVDVFSAGAAFADNNTSSGVRLLVTAGLWGAFLLFNFLTFASRERRIEKVMTRASDELLAFVKSDHRKMHERKENERKNSQASTVKSTKANPSRSQKAGARPTRTGAKKISTVKKGV